MFYIHISLPCGSPDVSEEIELSISAEFSLAGVRPSFSHKVTHPERVQRALYEIGPANIVPHARGKFSEVPITEYSSIT